MNTLHSSIGRLGLSPYLSLLLISIAALLSTPEQAQAVAPEAAGITYDIIYVRYPRRGDDTVVEFPDGENPYAIVPGADLMLLHPDGSEEILVDCRIEGQESMVGGQANCSVQDPVISFDGNWVYYSKYVAMGEIPLSEIRRAWMTLTAHSFLFKMALNVPANQRVEIQLTNVGRGFAVDKLANNGPADAVKDFGIRDLTPTPLPDGRLLFTSNRDAVVAFRQGVKNSISKVSGSMVSQIHIVDDHDGSTPNKNLHVVGSSVLHQAQHPTMLKDGRVLFTNWDDAGLRDEYATATLYVDHPDGGHLQQFLEPHHTTKRVEHFATEVTSGDIIVATYYPRMATWGFGTLLRMPVDVANPEFIGAHTAEPDDERRYFTRKGTDELTPHTTGSHRPPADLSGRYSTPTAAPNDAILVSYSDGPVGQNIPCDCIEKPRVDAGIYFITNAGSNSITNPYTQLVELKNSPDHNEIWPRAVVPYQDIHGVSAPSLTVPEANFTPTPRNRGLAAGSPIGLTGTSSMQNRESAPLGRDRFNSTHGKDGGKDTGWVIQGADSGFVTNDDLWGVRILVMTPDRYHDPWNSSAIEKNERLLRDTRMSRHVKGYYTHTSENWKILGEFPVRNSAGTADPSGEEDTSWLAKIPADTAHLIQSIDRFGMTLSTEQTWRHVRAGETVANCGGCHAHSLEGVPFTGKWADSASYQPWDLVNQTPMLEVDNSNNTLVTNRADTGLWGVEFRRDIFPILQSKCASCHTSANNQPPVNSARLAMFDSSLNGFEKEVRAYRSLALDGGGDFNHGNTIPAGRTSYIFPQKSRYVRALQARASYLAWKIYDARLDGRSNSDLPGSSSLSYEDLDYLSGDCTAATLLTNDEKGLITRWIDLGAPINLERPRMRYTDDSLLPAMTLAIQETSSGEVRLRVGAIDIESGIDTGNSEVQITPSGGSTTVIPFSALSFDSTSGVGTYTLSIATADVTPSTPLQVFAVVQDNAGNKQIISRSMEEIKLAAGSLQFAIASTTAEEASGTTQITVQRSDGDEGTVDVRYEVTGGSATVGSDYAPLTGTLIWANGESGGKTFPLSIVNDNSDENDETVIITLSAPSNGATLGLQQTMTVTIRDDDIAGTLQFASPSSSVVENSGNTQLIVNRSSGSDGAIAVNYAVTGGSAVAGSDYLLPDSVLNWAHGETSKSITLSITDDSLVENEETIVVTLSNPTNGSTLGALQTTTITINDNDIAGTLGFAASQQAVSEESGNTSLSVNRTLGQDGAIAVNYAVTGGSATSGSDYLLSAGVLNWANRDTTPKTIPLEVIDDYRIEGSETVVITLSNPTNSAVLGVREMIITINDNDVAGTLQFSSSEDTVSEGLNAPHLITVNRTNGSDDTVTVDYSIAGTATENSDYTLPVPSGTLTWENGDSAAKNISLTILNDQIAESNETVVITLNNPTNSAVIGTQNMITITINDDDTAGILQFSKNLEEVNEGSGTIDLYVDRSNARDGAVSVSYSVREADTTATSDDYILNAGVLNWGDNDDTEKVITLEIKDDNVVEDKESVVITLSSPTNGAVIGSQDSILVVINDDDGSAASKSEVTNVGWAGSFSTSFILFLVSLLALRARKIAICSRGLSENRGRSEKVGI